MEDVNKNKAIFFIHHKTDAFTKWNYLKFKQLNPDWDLIPVGFEGSKLLPNSLTVSRGKYPTNEELMFNYPSGWIACSDVDLIFYDSYFQRPNYEKYFFIEYDTVANVSIEKFFPAVNTFESFGSCSHCVRGTSWIWAKEYKKCGGKLKNLASIGQTTCVFYTNKILKQVSEEVVGNKDLYNNMLSELRCGTITRKFTKVRRPRRNIGSFINWKKSNLIIGEKEYFYHPIKTFKEWDELNDF